MLQDVLNRAKTGVPLTEDDLTVLLSVEDKTELQQMFDAAYQIKTNNVGNVVYFRGLIEFSNICAKDCNYCGIRRGNPNVKRFQLSMDEVVDNAKWAYANKYGSIVLQAGERRSEKFVATIETVLYKIHEATNGELGVTLSLGEQTQETYRRWAAAGAHRYLLRVETTNRMLYSTLHPKDHDWDERFGCLTALREEGYQVGTGVMMGLPGQTIADLVQDLLFFRDFDIDMIGMGPFIPHDDTPLRHLAATFDKQAQLNIGLKMIAATRLFLRDVNIASTTALQALSEIGRETGILAGANIVMPNITATKYRAGYQLYRDKPGLDENSEESQNNLQKSIESLGEVVGYGKRGDSPHFKKRQ